MADKEERVLIYEIGEQCQYRYPAKVNHFDGNGNHTFTDEEVVCHLESQWGEECNDNRCKKCDKKQCIGISRQEAIEVMAKALRSNIVETQAQCSCLNMAEAALNALLGVEK